jgi:two-component system sensor histidine kinase EvgS
MCSLLLLSISSVAEHSPVGFALTDGERQWLAAKPIVEFTGDPNWLPYEAFDEHGNYKGIVSEYLKLIATTTGLQFKMSPSKTWTESTEKAKKGLVDILSETDDSDLKSHLNFTAPYISNPIVIAMRNRENYVENISKIKDRKIALIKDYGYAAKIRRQYANIKFVTVEDIQDGLISVSTGKVDALLCTLALCSYTIAELGLNDVKITGKTEFDTKLALGVQKNLPELLSILNKGIKQITPEQQQIILDKWIKDKYVERIDYTLVFQVGGVGSVLLGIFFFWNRRLAREIKLRKATEKELSSTEEVLSVSHQRLLLHREHTPLGVIQWNTNFEVVDWNKAAEKMFGFTKEEVQGRHITEHILPESARAAVDIVWENLLKASGGERSSNENVTKSGRVIQCEWYNTPLIDQDGKVIGVASLVDDVTERQQAESELKNTKDHLEELVEERTAALAASNRELESYSYSIAHDLRAPLRSIVGFGQILQEETAHKLDEEEREHLGRMIKAAGRMAVLIDEILQLARLSRASLNRQSVDLSAAAKRIADRLSSAEPQCQVKWSLQEGVSVQGDPTLLEVVLENYFSNAWKYSSKKDCRAIEFGAHVEGDEQVVFVKDNGAGFSMDYINKLFVLFQRLHDTSQFEGSGVGLASAARIIQRHGGRVWAEGEEGKGACFFFSLPLKAS